MQVSQRKLHEWILLFPRHPISWILGAALLVIVFTRPTQKPAVPSTQETSSRPIFNITRAERAKHFAWLNKKSAAKYEPLVDRIAPPDGFERVDAPEGSYGAWLRHLPVMPAGAPVLDGRGKLIRSGDDAAIAAVIDLHATNRNLLNAANMAVRLRAEYLWAAGKMGDSHFTFTSGDPFDWKKFASGERPYVKGRTVTWKKEAPAGETRDSFAAFIETLLRYSSSINLERDTTVVDGDAQPGDMFVIVGRPGHAVVVLDVAVAQDGRRLALLGEGLTPPQSFHVLKAANGSPWFELDRSKPVTTPTWGALTWRHYRRWP